jgi:hypothetical protein
MSSLRLPVLPSFVRRRLIPPTPTEGEGGAPAFSTPAERLALDGAPGFLRVGPRLVRAFVIGLDGFRIIHVCLILPVLTVGVNLSWQVRAPDLENAHD